MAFRAAAHLPAPAILSIARSFLIGGHKVLQYSTISNEVPNILPPSGPLVGVKVLDVGQVVAGNFCGALLAYFGADVIKIEPPGRGDALRSLRQLDASGTSLWWRAHGRNRRCITADLHQEEGRDLVRRLAARSDVLVENFRPGVMEAWGLGPDELAATNPGLVYVRISGYGQNGPKAREAGYASVCEAFGGLRSVNGYPDRPPVRPNISLGDSLAGLHAAFGATLALVHRDRSAASAPPAGGGGGAAARGQVVDASITESVFNMLESCVTEAAACGVERPMSGSTISGVVPSGTFKCHDGRYVVIGGNGDSVYSRLMEAIGRPDMAASNPSYASNSKRVEREDEIMGEISSWVEQHSLEEVLAAMKLARVPSGPILTTLDLLREPQFVTRGMFHPACPPGSGASSSSNGDSSSSGGSSAAADAVAAEQVVLPALLPLLSRTPGATRWAGPALGHHTEEVLSGELGMTAAQIQLLRDKGAI